MIFFLLTFFLSKSNLLITGKTTLALAVSETFFGMEAEVLMVLKVGGKGILVVEAVVVVVEVVVVVVVEVVVVVVVVTSWM